MKPSDYSVKIDWLVENFTCWMNNVHGDDLESPDIPYFPGFKATLHKSLVNELLMIQLSCVYGEQSHCKGKVGVFFADELGIVYDLHQLPEDGRAVTVQMSAILNSFIWFLDRGDNIRLRFLFSAPRADFVSVGMSTTLEVLSDVTATFSSSELLKNLVSGCDPKIILHIRYASPDKKGEEELLQLELVYFNDEYYLQMKGVTKWAFHGITCKIVWNIYSNHGNLINSEVRYETFERVMHCGRFRWDVTKAWKYYLLRSRCSHIRIQIKLFDGKISRSIRGGGVWKRKKLDFLPNTRAPRPRRVASEMDDNENWINLRHELSSTYQDKRFTDFEFRCEGKSISVHKAILCARSPVLKIMLSHDMRESSSNSVDIEDIDAHTLEQFVAFLYTGAVGNLQVESALDLYYTADKYQVSNLKTECSRFLARNISVSSACDILSLADRHGDDQLTSSARNFILHNFRDVSKSEKWRYYTSTDPELLAITVTYFASDGNFTDIFKEYMDL